MDCTRTWYLLISVARVSASGHLHCTSTPDGGPADQLCVRAVREQGSCASCAGHRPFCARTHTRVPGAFTVEGAPPPPPASRPPPEWKCFFMENFPTVLTDRVRPLAKNLGTRSSWGGLWGVHEQYLSNLWATGHAVLCAWKPERRSFPHSKSYARLLSVRFFPEPIGELKTIHVGGRTDTTNRLSENHL